MHTHDVAQCRKNEARFAFFLLACGVPLCNSKSIDETPTEEAVGDALPIQATLLLL